MLHADNLTVVHHDDSQTRYTDVRYVLHRDGIRVFSETGQDDFTDVLTTHVSRHWEVAVPA